MGKVKKISGKSSEKGAKDVENGGKKPGGVSETSVGIKKKSKREKFAQKRKNLAQRLESGAPAGASGGTGGKKKKRRKPKAKVPVVGTLKDLRDALPSLESLIKFRSSVGELKTGIPEYDNKSEPSKRFQKLSRKAQKTKRAAKVNSEHVARMNQLQTLMQDKMFKQNPRQVIAEHIRNTRKMEDDSPWDYEEFLGQNVPQK